MEQVSISLLLFAGALLAFCVSTLVQRPIFARFLVWTAGAALLFGSAADSLGIAMPLVDRFELTLDDIGWVPANHKWILTALVKNYPEVSVYEVPLKYLTLVLGLCAAAVALYAFTPGYGAERVTVGWCLAAFFIVGGMAVSLAMVAVGYGGYSERAVYFGKNANVVDGDTFDFGPVRIRPAGIDAPERNQICFPNGLKQDCGEQVKALMAGWLEGRLVVCERVPKGDGKDERKYERDPYGRIISTCKVLDASLRGDGESQDGFVDVAVLLAERGLAVPLRDDNGGGVASYSEEFRKAKDNKLGLWGTCSLQPAVWRADKSTRDDFKNAILMQVPMTVAIDERDLTNSEMCPDTVKIRRAN